MKPSARITDSLRKEDANPQWWIIDASGMTIGRLATQVATLIRGKHLACFTPHVDCGDYVIVINAKDAVLQGKRVNQKTYFHHTNYPEGDKIQSFKTIMKNKPQFAIEHAVRGMLPKNRLGRKMHKKLKIYAGSEHPHSAQMPQEFKLKYTA
ncbi:MAG: 50S ribosomal protein L13 [Candidatus Kapabacteria bacterium]|nr:50S ribosomal protein L13 [Candidatus Kapabacteria bacterium]